MASVNWTLIDTLTIQSEDIHWPWKVVSPILRDVTHLQIRAQGSWKAQGTQLMPFTPDGHMGLPIQADKLLLSECPAGSLIGKIGGSSAGLSVPVVAPGAPQSSHMFSIGSQCIVVIPSGLIGPLFVGFNWMPRPIHVHELVVTVSGAAPG